MFHIPHGFAHIPIPMHAESVPPWTVKQSTFISWWDHWSSTSLDSAMGTRFYKLLSVFALLYTLHMSKLYIPTITETSVKPHPLAFILFGFQYWESPSPAGPISVSISSIFSTVNTYVTQHRLVCSTSLTSFVHVGSISMLTNRPCHGPWTNCERI